MKDRTDANWSSLTDETKSVCGLKKGNPCQHDLVPLVPFVLVLGIGYYYFTDSLEKNTIASIQRIVHDHRQMIESFLIERKANLEFILNTLAFEDLSRPDKLKRTCCMDCLFYLARRALEVVAYRNRHG